MADLKLAMVVSLVDRLTAPAKKVKNSVAGITAGIDDTAVAAKRASERINKVQGKVRNFGARMLRFGFGLSAAGYGFKRAFVDTAAQFEKFEMVLETIEGSSEKARQSMQWVSDFAAKTPYELAEVNDAFVKLRAYGMDPTSGLMRTLGDTSSAMGKPIMQAVEAIADAVTGENERLKEFGVKARALGEKIVYEYSVDGQTQTASADKSDRAAIESTLSGIFDSKFAGAMEKQTQTFDGMISNLMDQWTRFQQMVMASGVFDWMKERLGRFLDKLDRMAENGRLQEMADGFGQRLIDAFEWLEGAAKFVWPILRGIGETLAGIAQTLGGAGTAAVLGGVFAVGPITQFAAGLRGAAAATTTAGGSAAAAVSRWTMLGGAFKAAGVFLAGLSWPVIAIGAAVVAAGVLIWKYWEPLKAFFGGLWAGYIEALQPVTEALEPLWSGIKKVWDWIKRLFKPVEASEEQLASWAAALRRRAEAARRTDGLRCGRGRRDGERQERRRSHAAPGGCRRLAAARRRPRRLRIGAGALVGLGGGGGTNRRGRSRRSCAGLARPVRFGGGGRSRRPRRPVRRRAGNDRVRLPHGCRKTCLTRRSHPAPRRLPRRTNRPVDHVCCRPPPRLHGLQNAHSRREKPRLTAISHLSQKTRHPIATPPSSYGAVAAHRFAASPLPATEAR